MNSKNEETNLRKLYEYAQRLMGKENWFEWTEQLEEYVKQELGVHDPYGYLQDMVQQGVLIEPTLGRLQFAGKGLLLKGDRKMKDEPKTEGSKPSGKGGTVSKDTQGALDASTEETGIKKADDRQNIRDVLPSDVGFGYPLVEEFIGDEDRKNGVLEDAEIIHGSYGESATLKLDGEWYRSGGSVILKEVKALLERDLIPEQGLSVCVAKERGKSGRIYHTLRGGLKDEDN
jgi:hypothetical protein